MHDISYQMVAKLSRTEGSDGYKIDQVGRDVRLALRHDSYRTRISFFIRLDGPWRQCLVGSDLVVSWRHLASSIMCLNLLHHT